MYTAIDLFSGCGGLTEGLKLAGFNVIAAVEIDQKAAATYRLNHGDVKLYDQDIRLKNPHELLNELQLKVGDIDLIAGCPPCQGFSTLRTRNNKKAFKDDRNNLIDVFASYVLAMRPKLIMMENVPKLATYSRFQKFIKTLKSAGYKVRYEVMDVADYSVPQRRKRLILSASRIGMPALGGRDVKKITVRDAISFLPQAGKSGDSLHDVKENRSRKIVSLIKKIPKNGGSRKDLPKRMQLECHKKTNGFNDVYGRMKWDDVAPTITSGCSNPSKGRFLHPEEDRSISLREAAILQGFPINYQFDMKHGKQAISLMIGNALPPPFIAKHAKEMLNTL
jgi:DNA (cytosine-5)-methyltransferase 1